MKVISKANLKVNAVLKRLDKSPIFWLLSSVGFWVIFALFLYVNYDFIAPTTFVSIASPDVILRTWIQLLTFSNLGTYYLAVGLYRLEERKALRDVHHKSDFNKAIHELFTDMNAFRVRFPTPEALEKVIVAEYDKDRAEQERIRNECLEKVRETYRTGYQGTVREDRRRLYAFFERFLNSFLADLVNVCQYDEEDLAEWKKLQLQEFTACFSSSDVRRNGEQEADSNFSVDANNVVHFKQRKELKN